MIASKKIYPIVLILCLMLFVTNFFIDNKVYADAINNGDVDGVTGWYNLTSSWATGRLSGENILK